MFKLKKSTDTAELREMKPDKKKNKKLVKRIIIGGIIVVVLGLMIIPGMFKQEVLSVVMTQEVTKGDIEQVLSTSGTVESEEVKTYFANATGIISELNVSLGANIHAGDPLVVYDTEQLQDQYELAKLEDKANQAGYADTLAESGKNAVKYQNSSHDIPILEQQVEDQTNYMEGLQVGINDAANTLADLQSELANAKDKKKIKELNKRIKEMNDHSTNLQNEMISAQNELSLLQSNLSEQKSINASSEAAVISGNGKEKLAATSDVSKMTMEQAKKNLEKAGEGVSSEFNGIITEVVIAEGATVTPGTQLFTIASNEAVMLKVALTKYDLEDVKEGQSAEITLGANTYKGTVSKISRVATTNKAGAAVINAELHIDNPDDNIYLGVEAKVKISVGSASNVLLVPVECVNTDKDGNFCYVVENNVVVRKPVTTGLSSDSYMEIIDGLQEGDAVITDISSNITEGMAVNTMPGAAGAAGGTAQAGAAPTEDGARTEDTASEEDKTQPEEGEAKAEDTAE